MVSGSVSKMAAVIRMQLKLGDVTTQADVHVMLVDGLVAPTLLIGQPTFEAWQGQADAKAQEIKFVVHGQKATIKWRGKPREKYTVVDEATFRDELPDAVFSVSMEQRQLRPTA